MAQLIDTPNNSICILINTLNSGGAEKNCVTICNEFVRRGIKVELWITRLDDTPLVKLLDERVQIVSIPGKRIRFSIRFLKKQMIKCNAKVILIFNIELVVPAYFINKLYHLKIKLVARSISTLSLSYNNSHGFLGKKIWCSLIAFSFSRIEHIIAQSIGMKEDLIKNFKIPESKIKVIPNPALNLEKSNIETQKYICNSKEILFAGRLTQAKGLFYLLEIFQQVLKSIPDLRLTIVGSGELKEEIQDKIIQMGLIEAISLEGFQTELLPYYTRANATVLTSIYEGFPNVLVESISVGTPVISFDCQSGPKDIIIPEINGILVDYLDMEAFAKAIIDIVNKNIQFDRQEIIRSSDRFCLEKIINQYKEVLFLDNNMN